MSVNLLIVTTSPPSGPVVGPPKSFQSDQWQIHPGVGVRKVVFNVVDLGENAEAVVVNAIVDRVVDLLVSVEEVWTVGVIVGGIVMLADKLGEGEEVDVVVCFGVVVILVVVVVNENTVFVGKCSVVYFAVIPGKVDSAIKYKQLNYLM